MEKTIRIYQCEDNTNGILSAIYDAGISGYGHEYIRIQPIVEGSPANMELFSEYLYVETSDKKAASVLHAVKNKISYLAYDYVMKAILSSEENRGDVIYQFMTYGFTMGKDITKALQIPCVAQMFQIMRNVDNEAGHYIEFLRFSEIRSNPSVLMGVFEPKNRVLSMVANHFAERFNPEWFIIYDKRHKEAAFHSPDGVWEIRLLTEQEVQSMDKVAKEEGEYEKLWHVFFDTIEVKERHNEKVQKTNLALRYRQYMTEFQSIDKSQP